MSTDVDLVMAAREQTRARLFRDVWDHDLNNVFKDVARYYDRANHVASFGLWTWFRRRFVAGIEVAPGQRVLDVCADTNAIGMALLRQEPSLKVYALDQSSEMQEVGRRRAQECGMTINSTIGDAHNLPFPNEYFDVVTLQYATRHLLVQPAFSEILRVLKPGGHFYHCDMLRPTNTVVVALYYHIVRFSLTITSLMFGSGHAARKTRQYFVDALKLFYSASELSEVLRGVGFEDVAESTILCGTIGFHGARKPV